MKNYLLIAEPAGYSGYTFQLHFHGCVQGYLSAFVVFGVS